MSESKRYFNRWHNDTKKHKNILEARRTLDLFDRLTEMAIQNTALVLQNPKETAYLQFALDRIFGNFKANTVDAFIKWKKMTA